MDPGFQGVNRAFVLALEDDIVTRGRTGNFLSKVEIKQYNFKIDGQNMLSTSKK